MKQYYILTLGCQQNHSDSERIAGIFDGWGYKKVDSDKDADIIVINACSVRQKAIDRIYGKVRHLQKRREHGELVTILTGCVLDHDKEKLKKFFDHLIRIEDIKNLPVILGLGEALDISDYQQVVAKSESDFKASIPIMNGCNNFCTYCAVPYTRGREVSRPVNEIMEEVRAYIHKGYKEITLLGQNVNSYIGLMDRKQDKVGLQVLNKSGQPMKTIDFPGLLEMVAKVEGDFWIRFMSSHPYDMSDKLIETIAKYDKIVNHINLPIQAGDDEILQRMNRHYTVEHYLDRIQKIKKLCSPLSLSTDIIVGFPGETEEQFKHTADVMKKIGYDMAYISQYSVRPGTVAARDFTDDVPQIEKVKRDKVLDKILAGSSLKNNQKFIGQTIRILVDQIKDKKDGNLLNIGKSDLYKTCKFKSGRSYLGQFVQVQITEVEAFGLIGVAI